MTIYIILIILFALISIAFFTVMIRDASRGLRSARFMFYFLVSFMIMILFMGLNMQNKLFQNPSEVADNVLNAQVQEVVFSYIKQSDYYEADMLKVKTDGYKKNTPLKLTDYTVTNIVKKPKGQYITVRKNDNTFVIYDPAGKKSVKLEQAYTFQGSPSISHPFIMKLHYKEEPEKRFNLF